ncbi:hypothetical protein ACFC1R_35445 [Kitasatospora sp. NPDC056138]|uniref:hypothetical protein n=1 Tax=Kitasatospora sp. NPDC056138 TaxID=3345724 RepID=UPI0035DA04D7
MGVEAATFLVKESIEAGEPVYLVPRTIANWEDGKTAWPRAKYRRLLHTVTGRTATELGFTEPTYRGRATAPRKAGRRKAVMRRCADAACSWVSEPRY